MSCDPLPSCSAECFEVMGPDGAVEKYPVSNSHSVHATPHLGATGILYRGVGQNNKKQSV